MRAGCPVGSSGGHEVAPRRPRARLLLATVLCVALSAPAQAATPLRTIVEDVPGSTAYRYGARDNMGNSMHTLKIVKSPFGSYLGVYHTVTNSAVRREGCDQRRPSELAVRREPRLRRLATDDLPAARGAELVAYESHAGCPGGKRCLALRHYGTESALLSGVAIAA